MKKILLAGISGLVFITMANSSHAYLINYNDYESLFDEPITKSANGTPQRLSDVSLNMEILTEEDIEKSGARSIPELLRFMPGVNVKQYTLGQTEVSIRGYNQGNSERILVLVDGRQVYLDSFGQVVWENIPVNMEEIKQIEVIKGPNTALFGFNAVSGVINIVTKDPAQSEMAQIKTSVSVGSESMFETSGTYIAKTDDEKYAVKISARGMEADNEFKSFGLTDYDTNPTDTKTESVSVDFDVELTETSEVQFTIGKNDSDRNEILVTGHETANYYKTDSAKMTYIADTKAGTITFDTYFNQSEQDFYRGTLFYADNKIFVTKLSDVFEYDKSNIFRVGVEYRDASNIYEPYDNADLDYQIYSASGLWSWNVNDKLSTNLGVRYDYFKLSPDGDNVSSAFLGYGIAELGYTAEDFYQTREEVSLNLGAVYQLSSKETIKASYARGVDLPSFTEFGLQLPNDTDTIRFVGNPYTDTSIVSNYELDYERRIKDIDGVFKAAVFYQTSEDMQGFGVENVTDATLFSITGNIGDSEAAGFELSLKGKYRENWNWEVGYSYVKVNDDFANTTSGVYTSPTEYENSTPEHTVDLVLGYTAPKWNANLGLQYVSSHEDLDMVVNQEGEWDVVKADGEFILNAHYAYNITDNIKWSVSGQNMLGDTKQYAASSAEPMYWTSMEIKF